MKKVMKRLAAFAVVAAMCVAMVACGKPSIADYLKDEDFQKQLETMKTSMASQGMEVDIKADGDSLIYVFKIAGVEKSDELASALESAMSAQDDTFQETADSVKEEVSNKTVKVVIQYVDQNGEEIYSKTYTAK